ncbi:hypothetical protein V2A60_007038 [Cordyceps javanica]
MENQSTPLTPTFEGHIASTLDALLLFESCLDGTLNHVPRRPHDRERQELIKSGNIFIYEEHSSGIKRWTDGVSWSPSRILGNFLIYRELEKPFPPGEKKRALKKSKKSPQGIAKPEALSHPNMSYVTAGLDQSANTKDQERSLIGSLVDSYPFKTDGLVKKTISISYQGVAHHMVSYYNVDDVTSGKLDTPTNSILMRGVTPRSELFLAQNFRTPIDEVEYAVADHTEATPTHYGADQVSISNGSGVLHRAMMQGNLQNAMNIQQSSSSAAYVFPQHSPGTHNGYTGPVANSSFQAAMPQQMSYAANPVGNYSLDPNRAGHSYLSQHSYYMPHQQTTAPNTQTTPFPMSRGLRAESNALPAASDNHYNIDGASWNFDSLEGEQQQYYAQNHVQWSNGPNPLHRA